MMQKIALVAATVLPLWNIPLILRVIKGGHLRISASTGPLESGSVLS